jgi:PAS domain S-box-containing protein
LKKGDLSEAADRNFDVSTGEIHLRDEETSAVRYLATPTSTPTAEYGCLIERTARGATGRIHHLQGAVTTLGRADASSLRIDDASISRRHAELCRLPDGSFQLTDLGSRNGTFVNGERISTRAIVPGDQVMLGGARPYTFWLEAHSSDRTRGGPVLDLAARKKNEEELRRQALLFDSLVDAVLMFDRDGLIIDWNRSAQRMFGWTKAEVLGKTPAAVLRQRGQDGIEVMRLALARDGRWQSEFTVQRKDDKELFCEVLVMPLHNAEGQDIGGAALHRDITERRQLEARLQIAGRMASIGTLAAGVAHEINNPLAFMAANLVVLTEMLEELDGAASPAVLAEFRAILSETQQGANRIRDIVRDLKGASSVGAESQEAAIDVNAALELALRMADHHVRQRARVIKKLGEPPFVSGQASKLGQVFLNLLINAAQAIPESMEARKEITVTTGTDFQSRAFIEISDTGAGIDPNVLPRIFDPFFTTKQVGGGTGLGLAICHGILTAMGGEITVKSVLGEGTTFRICLPASELPPGQVAQALTLPPPTRPGRVLIIDDDPLVGQGIGRLLGREHQVRLTQSVLEALPLLREQPPYDLILCDLMMPEITGMDLHEQLRDRPELLNRLVFMTGGAFTPRAAAFVEHSGATVLQKPLDLEQLSRVLMRALAHAAPR